MVLEKNTTNKLIFTGTEKGTLINPSYLIEFIKDDTKEKVYCIGIDSSTNILVYNRCDVTDVSGTPNPLNSEVKLNEGFYIVNFYEQLSTTNLDPTGLTKVETKILRVMKSNYVSPIKEYNNSNNTTYVYNG